MASPLVHKLASSPMSMRAKSPVFRSFSVGLSQSSVSHVSVHKSPSLVTVSVTDETGNKTGHVPSPKVALFAQNGEASSANRLRPHRQPLHRLYSFSSALSPGKKGSEASPTSQNDTATFNSPLNSSLMEFSATRSCQALVQSPCRADQYKSQRRRLYKNEPSVSESSDTQVLDSDTSVSVDCVADLPKSFGFTIRKDSLCRTDSVGSNGPRSASTPSSAGTPIVGKGGFGSVFIGRYDGRRVAIKQLHNRPSKDGTKRESFRAELNAFKLLRHPNIVKIITFTPGPTAQIVYEYVGRRNLQELLEDDDEGVSFSRRFRFVRQVADALFYCHSNRLLHLDVKASNVLLTDHGDLCKLADFGCSRPLPPSSDTVVLSSSCMWAAGGTLIYTAPELLQNCVASAAADVYSYGLLLWQCLSRKVPFQGQHAHTTVYLVVKRDLRPDCSFIEQHTYGQHDLQLLSLAQLCWQKQPDLRPAFDEICKRLDAIVN